MSEIAAVKRLDVMREPLKHVAANRRPGLGALRDAARSRRMIYRHAIAAYITLTGIEAGEEEALRRVLNSTLIAPLDQWRRFELAVAAIIEVKYVAADTAAARFREAVSQVVRYARGYSGSGSIDQLIRRSLIVLSIGSPDVLEDASPTVGAVDFPAIREGALRGWVRDRLLSQSH